MELAKRKRTRLKDYDYSTPGAYFITICTKDRKELLSQIIVGDGVLDVPKNVLTEYGKIANHYILNMDALYEYISVDKYVIMPNHIHLLIRILNIDKNCENGSSRTPNPTNSIISRFVSTFKRFCNKEYGENIWQRSANDHIIRDEEDYRRTWEYIDTNIIKWEKDDFYNSKTRM